MKPVFSYAGLSRIATVATAFLFSGCGEHVVVLELSNLSADATTVSAYYKIETDSYRAQSIATTQLLSGKPALGFRAPAGRDGTMNIQVFGYKNQIPCALSKGNADVNVGGAGKITAQLVLDNGASGGGCLAGDAPVRYPADAKVWAAAANDVWIVGKDAAVLHWNGALFREISLPDSVTGTPRPTWNAVRGDSQGNVWLVGGNSVVRISPSGVATTVPVQWPRPNITTPLEITGVDCVDGAVRVSARAGLDEAFVGEYSTKDNKMTIQSIGGGSYPLLGLSCSALYNCWFVGKNNYIVQQTNSTTFVGQKFNDNDASCVQKNPDAADWISVATTKDPLKARMVGIKAGESRTYFAWPTTFPPSLCQDYVEIPGGSGGSPVASVSGDALGDPVVVSNNSMYRWNATGLVPLPNPPKGVWQSVSAVTGGGFFATGVDGRIYYGTLSP